MNIKFFLIVCSICVPENVFGFVLFGFENMLREFLFPRNPTVKRVRSFNETFRYGNDNDVVLDTVGLAEQYGYKAEDHNVTTPDGYVITFFRITGSPRSPPKSGKPIVFLQHGMLASSDSWVLIGPKNDLAFMLADKGYDVWMGNVRGNSYGRFHSELTTLDAQFWDFSFHEMALYDLPTMIDYALENTSQKSLYYIGHSMGTTMAYILLSQKPQYNVKMKLFIAMAPVALWKGAPNPYVQMMIRNSVAIKQFLGKYGIYELLPQTTNNVKLGRVFCSNFSFAQSICSTVYFILAGDDPKQLNANMLPKILSYLPAGFSVKTLDHYGQNIVSGIFQPYDSGYIQNFKLYGKKKPPAYDLKKISVPVALIYGNNDALSRKENTVELAKKIKNIVTLEAVPFELFNHLDFLWARNAKELLFLRIFEILSKFPM